ncbi:hypothetical protein DZG01_17325 [Pseudomonas fluorescens]|nr:hypothetical protein DZG01_17325 [Pseudomonas fluorescens]
MRPGPWGRWTPRRSWKSCWADRLWEQSLLAIQAAGFQRDRVVFIAGKPCSHKMLVRHRSFSNPNSHANALSCPPSKHPSPQDSPS